MEERYSRNIPSVSAEEQAALARRRVLVAGCGGLGGYLIEYLARMGVGEITAVDGDMFEPSNLNRQLLSTQALLGTGKALAARERVRAVNPAVAVRAVEAFLDGENAGGLVRPGVRGPRRERPAPPALRLPGHAPGEIQPALHPASLRRRAGGGGGEAAVRPGLGAGGKAAAGGPAADGVGRAHPSAAGARYARAKSRNARARRGRCFSRRKQIISCRVNRWS